MWSVVEEIQKVVASLGWWHVIEVAPGVTTPGSWDLRPTAGRMPWPSPIAGLRCLDVGTMDGFWAFEMERQGAGEVVAIDIDPSMSDFARVRQRVSGSSPEPTRPPPTFRMAADLLDSRVRYRHLSVYDLDPDDVGEFDLILMGYVLQMLRDPLRGLAAVRHVCRGHLILLDTISRPLNLLPAPLARLDARRDGSERFVFNRRGLVKSLQLAGFEVEATTPVLRDHYPHRRNGSLPTRALHTLGLRGRSMAIRARPTPDPDRG